eukprot:3907914-Pyramimonas_sp.AAC.1
MSAEKPVTSEMAENKSRLVPRGPTECWKCPDSARNQRPEAVATSTQLRRCRKAEGSENADSSACKPSRTRIAAAPEVAWGPCLSVSAASGRKAT